MWLLGLESEGKSDLGICKVANLTGPKIEVAKLSFGQGGKKT